MFNTKLIETDSLNEDNNYYLYEVETDSEHYYVSTSDEEIKNHNGEISFINNYTMLGREDFTDREWEIAKYLFLFLWDSSNGTNTCVDKDYYEEDGFTKDEMEKFVSEVNKRGNDGLDIYEDGGVEIYWAFFSMFDLKKCNPFEDREAKVSERYLLVFDKNTLDMSTYLTWYPTLEDAKRYLEIYNNNNRLVQENGKIHIELETKTRKIITID